MSIFYFLLLASSCIATNTVDSTNSCNFNKYEVIEVHGSDFSSLEKVMLISKLVKRFDRVDMCLQGCCKSKGEAKFRQAVFILKPEIVDENTRIGLYSLTLDTLNTIKMTYLYKLFFIKIDNDVFFYINNKNAYKELLKNHAELFSKKDIEKLVNLYKGQLVVQSFDF